MKDWVVTPERTDSDGQPVSHGSTILVADDDAALRASLVRLLSENGHVVIEAANGQEAIDRIRAGGVDLLITDLVMPVKEGIETIQELHFSHPQLPIVAISSGFQWTYLKAARMLGASATLAKPIEPEQLLTTIRELLPHHRSGSR